MLWGVERAAALERMRAAARLAGRLRPLGGASLAATIIIAPALAGLFWMSGTVSIAAAVGAMVLFALVIMWAGFLLLHAFDASDMPAPAAWVLGILGTAFAIYALVMAFHLLAASAFAIWAVIVVGLNIVFRQQAAGARRIGRDELLGLLMCAAPTAFWRWELAQVPEILSRNGVLATWADQFIHGASISQFGDPRAAGRGAIELADLPIPFYHYASYMLPAAFAGPLDLPG